MVYSMTAFARTQEQGEWGTMICEMRSINHRYLELSVYLPELLRALEMPIREQIRQKLNRGKVECTFKLKSSSGQQAEQLVLNQSMVKALATASSEIADILISPGTVNPADIMRFPGVLETKEADTSALQATAAGMLKTCLEELLAARQREGGELTKLFIRRAELIEAELTKVKARLPSVQKEQREKLLKRFEDVKLELDTTRLEQEMVMFAQRIDVAEEIERTETHLGEMRRILKAGGVVGRRLDFLMQELNREANTLGSKSVDTVLTHAAVEMKVLVEQMREQVQNIE